jgi:hypothetical protein
MKRMSKEDARRLADQLVRLPDVVEELRQQREARPYPEGANENAALFGSGVEPPRVGRFLDGSDAMSGR